MTLDVLVLEPWLGGSHERFLRQWQKRSELAVELVGLPARHWKWRMRDGARRLAARIADRRPPNVLCATSYVDLPSFFGFAPPSWGAVPSLLFLHENQLTYPLAPGASELERDRHFGYTNVLACLRADHVSFNSDYHRRDFAAAADRFLATLPSGAPRTELRSRLESASVVPPGIELERILLGPGPGPDAPLRVAFPHRWEHDKDPAAFLRAVLAAGRAGLFERGLELVLLGERYAALPEGVEPLLAELAPWIAVDGFQASWDDYVRELGRTDVVVSTARHEFFGIAVAEAMAAGCTPLVPDRLAYPELVAGLERRPCGDGDRLVRELLQVGEDLSRSRTASSRARNRAAVERFDACATAERLDELCRSLTSSAS